MNLCGPREITTIQTWWIVLRCCDTIFRVGQLDEGPCQILVSKWKGIRNFRGRWKRDRKLVWQLRRIFQENLKFKKLFSFNPLVSTFAVSFGFRKSTSTSPENVGSVMNKSLHSETLLKRHWLQKLWIGEWGAKVMKWKKRKNCRNEKPGSLRFKSLVVFFMWWEI